MKKRILTMLVVAVMTGCASTGYDPTLPDVDTGAISAAKADGAFGAETISLGDTATGTTAGDGFVLYAIHLDAGDRVRLNVRRTDGDLRPSGYLYRGTEVFVHPDDYEVDAGSVHLDYTIADGGEHHIVVKAYHGEGAGSFELVPECTGGTCDGSGIPTDPLLAQSYCIESATSCSIADLPRWGGAVAETRARNIFADCLAAEGDLCANACDDADGREACDLIIGQLPDLADQSTECVSVLNSCLDDCAGMGGYYSPYELSDTAASACWDGYNGNCLEFIGGHDACGGDSYSTGSLGECRARCSATEGAWDEGPWDGCMEPCDEMQDEIDVFISSVADEAGEYLRIDGSDAFGLARWEDLDSSSLWRVDYTIRQFDEAAMRDGRADRAARSEEVPFSITQNGEIVGYVVGVDYVIDAPLFDGAGVSLYINLDGELVTSVEWSG